jgi:hypothetical protein
MSRKFDPISSLNTATRDVGVDFSTDLETGETLTSATVVSSDVRLVISNINYVDTFTYKNEIIVAGRGVSFTMTSTGDYRDNVMVNVKFVGDQGSSDTYGFVVSVVPTL